MEIRGRTVLITGGCGAIGLAMASRFEGLGMTVVLLDRDIAKAKDFAADRPRARLVEIDLSDGPALAECLDRLKVDGLAPDILINNVAISPKFGASGQRLRSWTITLDQWQQVFDTNVTSYFCCTRELVPTMMERGYGRIINIASYAARTGGYQAASHYQTSKNAVLGLTRAVAREVAQYGITVNAINPGRIVTPMTKDVPAEVNDAFIKAIPLGRLGVPDDIAKVAVFLASDLADYITGAAIEVNGGVYMGP